MGCNLRVQSGRENRCPLHHHTILTNSFSSSSSQSQFLLLTTREIWCPYWSAASFTFPNPMSFSQASVQFSSVAQSRLTLCDPMDHSTPGLPVHHQLPELLKLMSFKLVMLSNHLILCRPLLLLPSIFPSIRIFPNETVLCIRWPKYWSFNFSISPSNQHSGLISFRMDWLDLLAVQGTLKSLLQHHSSKASILQCSAFFIVQLTSIHDYWKNHSFYQMGLCWQSNVSAF